jgi:hypothetical protein
MSEPNDPQYPQAPPPQPPPATPARGARFSGRLGLRAVRRPAARQGVALAGVGVGLAVVGVIVWGGDFLTSGGDGGGGGGDSRRVLGIGLSLLVVATGYVLVIGRRRGPLATAGVAASALGLPVLLGFLTYDATSLGSSGLPFSLDAIAVVSVLAWVISYLFVAGARGHAFYVGLATVTIWIYLLDKATSDTFAPANLVGALDPFGIEVGVEPDWSTVAALSLVFGLGYYVVGLVLDRAGRHGAAVPFIVSGFLATTTGIAAAATDLHAIGTGVLLIVVGLFLGAFAARARRRFTTWAWSAGVAVGVIVIIGKLADDNNTAAGLALIASGAVIVLVAQLLSTALLESDDMARDEVTGSRIGSY